MFRGRLGAVMISDESVPMISEMEHNYEEWMSSLPTELWDVPITSLAIPGSHDAMSYCLDITSPLVGSESDAFRLLDGLFYCVTRPAIFRWTTTQDKCIVDQLSMGIRYFDLRIAHKPNDPSDTLYFTHIIYTYVTVLAALSEVVEWLESHPKEVVILACRHFEGLSEKLHETFISSLKTLFGPKLCPCKEAALTLRSLWASGHQVLLSYDSQCAARHPELWPAIPYLWANKPTAEELESYLDWQKELGRPEGLFVAGLNLTASRCHIALHPGQSLRTLTKQNWDSLKSWLGKQTPGPHQQGLNIIAGDFVGPLPICPLVIALNKKLLRQKPD
ncbi:PI-PLC X domain-containing protein 1 isoform X1 [Osmerus eperlanus]|uniref:PI-PLC X domain-containing protein 1 isoform X1 n=1 Tax=Osmerus eperlanus TaxID=29151 RepID=UPI002E0E953F